jgi:hypothetical protein
MLFRKTTNLKKSEKKKGKKNGKEKIKKNEKKYIPTGNGRFTKNILYKDILTP